MERIEKLINDILAKWDPIGVPEHIAEVEYSGYIGEILKNSGTTAELIKYLEHLVGDIIGLNYEPSNKPFRDSIESAAADIYRITSTSLAHCVFCNSVLDMQSRDSAELTIRYNLTSGVQNAFVHIRCLKEMVSREFPVLDPTSD